MMDTRIKATVTSTMYDMCRATGNGYFDAIDANGRWEMLEKMNAQRTVDVKNGAPARAGGVPDKLPDDAPWFVKDYFDYYKTKRGYHPRSLNSNAGWNVTSFFPFVMSTLLGRPEEIRNAVMLVHGDKAHSVYFSKDIFPKLKGDNKRLLLVPGAVHTDLYDKKDVIPFDEIEKFYRTYLV